MKMTDRTPMKDAVNPVMNHDLYAQAERAALAAFSSAAKESPRRRMKLMDRAAAAVFRQAGTPADAAELFACAITADILERVRNA